MSEILQRGIHGSIGEVLGGHDAHATRRVDEIVKADLAGFARGFDVVRRDGSFACYGIEI